MLHADTPSPSASHSIPATFEHYRALWLEAAERALPDAATRERITAIRAAELRAERLAADNIGPAVDVVFEQFRREPLTLAVGFPDDVLRATLHEVLAGAAANDLPSLVVYAHGIPCSVAVTTPFEVEPAPPPPDLPPAVVRLFGAIGESNAAGLARRQRIGQPLDRPFEWLIAAAPANRRWRLPVGQVYAPATIFHVNMLTIFEVARGQGYRTVVAHTNPATTRNVLDMGFVMESTIPYRELRSRARDDIPGSIDFITADLASLLSRVGP